MNWMEICILLYTCIIYMKYWQHNINLVIKLLI